MSDLDELLLKLAKEREVNPSNKDRIKVTEDVKIKKVAFDMYKVFGDQYNDLWKIEQEGDSSFLVRSSHPQYGNKEEGLWSTASSYDGDAVTLSYKNIPICSFSSEEYGFSKEDVFTFKSALLDMIKEDSKFIGKVVDAQSPSKAAAIKELVPDLFKTN